MWVKDVREARRQAEEAVKRAKPTGPTTQGDWLEYMEKHKDQFRQRMRTATKDRRERSRRMTAREDIAAPVGRLQPKPDTFTAPKDSWATLVSGRHGLHGLLSDTGDLTVMFVCSYEKVTYGLNVSDFQDGEEFELKRGFNLSENLKPLSMLLGHLP